MFNFRAFYVVLLIFFLSVFISYNVNAQTYLPVGPQTNVPVDTVTGGGWTECYRDTYDNHLDPDVVLSQCTGSQLMLSCRPTGSDALTLLAQGNRSDVTFDTGQNTNVLHIANGVGWYFNFTGGSSEDGNSWGFVRAGDSVNKVNCDIDSSGADDERLCWHLQDAAGGYRCGATQDIFGDSYERIVYTLSLPTTRPIPTLSEWGMISAAAGLMLVGVFFAVRKRRMARA